MLKCHLVMGLCGLVLFYLIVTGAWSLMTIGWIFDSEIFDMTELLVRKKSMQKETNVCFHSKWFS